MSAKIILKCLKVRRILNKMAIAKENRIREIVGLPPMQSWFQACCSGVCSGIRETLCRAFCPCCVDIPTFGECCCQKGTFGFKLCNDGEYPNDILKSFGGFILGVALSMALFLFLSLQMKADMVFALSVAVGTGFVLSIGMGFFKGVRCLVFLILPNLCSSKGRGFLLVYAMVLVMNFPVKNFSHNMDVLTEAATCGASLAINETKDLIEAAAAPLMFVIHGIKKMLHAIRIFADELRKAFNALLKAVKEIVAMIGRLYKWLAGMVDICNDRMGQPYRKCKKAFDDAFDECVDVMWIFFFVCYIVKAVSLVCNIARITELLCLIVSAIKDLVLETVAPPIMEKIQDLKEMFYFNVTINYHFHYNMNQSRPYSEIKKAIMKEIREKLSIIDVIQVIIDNVMSFTILLVVFKGFSYRRKYLHKDGFDNVYITRHMFEIEARRQEREEETLFPLRHEEKFKYIPTFSYWMTKNEVKKLIKGVIFWLFAAFHAVYYMACDYAVYWILDLVRRHMDIRTSSALPPHMQFHVRGKGPMSDMFKSMVGVVQPVSDQGLDVDTSACLPNPKTPNLPAYRTISIILVVTFFLTVFEAYALRLRHVVAACYYPIRERFRAVWLYNHIVTTRGHFLIFMRRQMRRKLKNEKAIKKISIISRLQAQFRLCKILCRLLGRRRKHCLSCGLEGKEQDMDNFIHCDNCKSPYCNECFISLGNVCTACMNPVDYGDSEDLSVETDSSEDEEDRVTRVTNLQARKQMVKKKQVDKEPANVLKSFQTRFTTPESQSPYDQYSSLMNKAGSRRTSSSSSDDNGNESSIFEESTSQYDTDYQYLSKRSTPSQSEDERPRRKRLRKRIPKVTVDIFHKEHNNRFWRTLPV